MSNLPTKEENLRVVACPHPFEVKREEYNFPPSISLAQILKEVQPDELLSRKAHIWVNDDYVPVEKWESTFPEAGSEISIRVVPAGKVGRIIGSIVIAIVAIAATILVPYLMGPAWPLLGPALGGLAGMAVGIVGSMVLNALIPPTAPGATGTLSNLSASPGNLDYGATSPTLSITGASNRENLWGTIPKILGKYKCAPPYGARTYTETAGADQYLRLVFVWGFGPVQIEDLRIGQTPIGNFQGVEMEHANLTLIDPNGVSTTYGDETLTLYPVTIQEEPLQIELLTNVENIHTSEDQADELSVDVVCPNGLYELGSDGSLINKSLTIRVYYRQVGGTSWSIPNYTSGDVQNETYIYLTAASRSAVRGNLRWKVSPKAQYDIKLVRITPPDDVWRVSVSYWTALRTITNQDPIQDFPFPLAKTAMRIKASGQLQGTVDEFTATVTSICPDWNTDGMSSVQINTAGTGYTLNDVLTVVQTGATTSGTLTVTSVGVGGTVVSVEITTPGTGHEVGTGLATTASPTNGVGCVIDILAIEDAWVTRATQNPASLYREAVQGNQNSKPLSNTRLDFTKLQNWHEYCQTNNWEYNKNIDYATSLKDLLDEIASSGRAAFAWIDSKLGIIIDEPQTFTIGPMFTPRNILKDSFQATMAYPDLPHAFRCPFRNENMGYEQDERVVLDDGYQFDGLDAWGDPAPTLPEATLFEQLDLPGITNPDLIFKHARYHIAAARLRPETIKFATDVEWLVATRGDRIKFAHDAMLVALGWGRVKEVIYEDLIGYGTADQLLIDASGDVLLVSATDKLLIHVAGGPIYSGNISGVVLDEELTMEESKTYVLRFRLYDNTSLLCNIGTQVSPTEVTFESSIYPADPHPEVGDLFLFGEYGLESMDLIIRSIQPNSDLSATITAVSYDEAIYTADVGTIPEYDSQITVPSEWWVPVVSYVRSDGSVLLREPDGSWQSRILLTLTIPSALDSQITGVEARYWLTGGSDTPIILPVVTLSDGEVSIVPVEDGRTYSYELRYVKKDGSRGTWSTADSHTVEGKTAPPEDVAGLSIRQVKEIMNFTWTQVPDKDLSGYEIRYGTVDCTWEEANVVVTMFNGTSFATPLIPPGEQDFLIKAIDTSGNYSLTATRKTYKVSEFYSILFNTEQYPLWSGTLNNFIYNPLTGYLNPDDQDIPSGDDQNVFDNYVVNPYSSYGYEAPEIDLGSDIAARAWARIYSNLGPEESGDNDPDLQVDYRTEVGSYDGFESWTIDTVDGRYFKFKVVMTTATTGLVRLTNFQPVIDKSY